jgi:hypothetical protein
MQSKERIALKSLLVASIFCISLVYYIVLTPHAIMKIIKGEYIFLALALFLFIPFLYLKFKLKNLTLIAYIPNINTVDIKTTLVIFLIFQGVDFYFENGFIGMISQWFIYWVFALLGVLLTNNINLYKNYQFYKYESMSDHKL